VEVNQFTGPIPSSYGRLENLSKLFVRRELFGCFRTSIKILTDIISVASLMGYANRLKGTVPEGFFNLPQLVELSWSHNLGLTGSIPDSISALQKLTYLDLHNTSLSGTLPLGLFDLSRLAKLYLNGTAFSGTLPTEFAKLTDLNLLQLDDSKYTGTIPSELGQLSFLGVLNLHDNELVGSVPAAICNRTNGGGFFDINVLTTDCVDKVSCDCCTEYY